jgi:hypothetical protein
MESPSIIRFSPRKRYRMHTNSSVLPCRAAPSTALRAVPLPRFAGEGEDEARCSSSSPAERSGAGEGDRPQGWALPVDPTVRGIHMGDITELGNIVAGAFAHPDKAGNGEYLPLVGDFMSFNEIIDTLNRQGHKCRARPASARDSPLRGPKQQRWPHIHAAAAARSRR